MLELVFRNASLCLNEQTFLLRLQDSVSLRVLRQKNIKVGKHRYVCLYSLVGNQTF